MSCRTCPRCGARWINGQLYWATGKPGSDLDLAGLVCNRVNDPACVNALRGMDGGDTWEARAARLGGMDDAIRRCGIEPTP